jgi:hypothetical protein
VFSLITALALRRPSEGRTGVVDLGLLTLVAVIGALPQLYHAMEEAQCQRIAFAAIYVSGDWNHPFLNYLLLRPSVRISLEPWVLRLTPLAYFCANVMLTAVAAARRGGRLAGALAGLWLAAEARRRHGISDLSDWDLAGSFLMATLIWLQREERPKVLHWILLAGLVAASLTSSWLAFLPAFVLIGCLAAGAIRADWRPWPVLGVAAMVVALAPGLLELLLRGGQAGLGHSTDILAEIYEETPMARCLWMAGPLGLGLGWLVTNVRKLDAAYALGSIALVYAGVFLGQRRNHINGGYYVGLVTPMILFAAAVACTRSVRWLAQKACAATSQAGAAADRLAAVLTGLGCVAVAATTAVNVTGGYTAGDDFVYEFALLTQKDSAPILTDIQETSLARLLLFERARNGTPVVWEELMHGPVPDLTPRIRRIDPEICAPSDGWKADVSSFWVADYGHGSRHLAACRAKEWACTDLDPVRLPDYAGRATFFFRCEREAKSHRGSPNLSTDRAPM